MSIYKLRIGFCNTKSDVNVGPNNHFNLEHVVSLITQIPSGLTILTL